MFRLIAERLVSRFGGTKFLAALLTGYGLFGINAIVQLILVPVYLNNLGPEKFGILTMIMAATNYAAVGIGWASGGIARILTERFSLRDEIGFQEVYSFSKRIFLIYSTLIVLGFWLISPLLLTKSFQEKDIYYALILSCIGLIASYNYNSDRLAFSARHLQAQGNIQEVFGQFFYVICIFGSMKFNLGLPGIMAAQVLSMLFLRTIAWIYWRKAGLNLSWRAKVQDSGELWNRLSGKTGRDYALYGVLLLTLQADVLIVGWLAGPETAGKFYLLWRIPEVCILMLLRIPATFSPYFISLDVSHENVKLKKVYQRGLWSITGIALMASITYSIAGPYVTRLWVGENAPVGHLQYFVAALAMFFVATVRWPAALAHSLLNTGPLIKLTSLELAFKLLLLVILLKPASHLAPVLATIGTHVLGIYLLYLKLGEKTCTLKST